MWTHASHAHVAVFLYHITCGFVMPAYHCSIISMLHKCLPRYETDVDNWKLLWSAKALVWSIVQTDQMQSEETIILGCLIA